MKKKNISREASKIRRLRLKYSNTTTLPLQFFAFSFFLLFFFSIPALAAVPPSERMADPALQVRAENLYKQVRCVVCDGQAIDSSGADVAADMRQMIRTRLLAGDSDGAILNWLSERYGDGVLMSPPLRPATLWLWFGPALVLAGGLWLVLRQIGKGGSPSS